MHNEDNLQAELDLIHEVREEACVREAVAKQRAHDAIKTEFEKDHFAKRRSGMENAR